MMRPPRPLLAAAMLLALPAAAAAQLVPPLGGVVGRTLSGVAQTLSPVEATLSDARSLARDQLRRVRDLARRYPDRIEIDRAGDAVRAGELVVVDPDDTVVAAAQAQGFRLIAREDLGDLGIGYARFRTPQGQSVDRALPRLRALAPGREVSADPLHFPGGALGTTTLAMAAPPAAPGGARIGLIDGGVRAGTPGLIRQQAFAAGAPRPNDHAAAIASLLTGGGGIRASAPGAALLVADVYGSDPAGGNAVAIARALAWLTREQVPVAVVSLVGPANPLLARVVAAARRRGTIVVAAVGNDGPAAPPAYPASYPQALAVTGVDARGRPLIEAGHATKLDYAAPGADLLALDRNGRARSVRGTSFAAPFVAARLAAHLPDLDRALAALDREAQRGGRATGRGILCTDCRTPPR
ncbi:MAG: S8 family serine peptidase [Sphingomonas adhaesiva]|uniref:S8 family serine peptidase n=1 Tax=Sphingomonas adhaesiva TaxID=28212 RepID=UPI002FFC58E7